jgi:hypothetical protein
MKDLRQIGRARIAIGKRIATTYTRSTLRQTLHKDTGLSRTGKRRMFNLLNALLSSRPRPAIVSRAFNILQRDRVDLDVDPIAAAMTLQGLGLKPPR